MTDEALRLPYRLRPATAADAAAITGHRVGMFRDMGELRAAELAPLAAASAAYLARALPSGEYRGWLAERDGAVIAGAGVVLRPLLPRPGYPDGGTEAYVLNVYTEPAHRRRGVARRLMETILDWSRAHGVARVTLHASDDGRPLYEALAFTATNEMRRDLAE